MRTKQILEQRKQINLICRLSRDKIRSIRIKLVFNLFNFCNLFRCKISIISITSFTRCNLWNIRYMWLKLHYHFSFTFVTPENALNSVSPVSHLINTRTSIPFRWNRGFIPVSLSIIHFLSRSNRSLPIGRAGVGLFLSLGRAGGGSLSFLRDGWGGSVGLGF